MPLNNYGETHIHGHYNDVAGSQIIDSQIIVLSSTSTALVPQTLANLPSIIKSPATLALRTLGVESIVGQTIIMPKSKNYQEFISLILHLQATLNPIIKVVGETEELRVLSQELSRTLATTALAGRIIEFLETDEYLEGLVWCRRLTDKVGRSVHALREVVDGVVQYRSEVRHRLTGSAKEQLWKAIAHFVGGERDIDGIAREALYKLIDCTNPLERFLCCIGQGLLHQFKYSFNETIWQDLSAEIQSHLTVPRFRSPHGMIAVDGAVFPFDSYTTYSDLCELIGIYSFAHGWVDTANEQLLSPKHLNKLMRQQSAPHIDVEPVYIHKVIGDSSGNSTCLRCGGKSSHGEWHVCLSCGLRFQTAAPKIPDNHWLELGRPNLLDRYVMTMRFDWSVLSSVIDLEGQISGSATALCFLRLLSNVDSPIAKLSLQISRSSRPSICIPNGLDTGSSPPVLQHLTRLILDLNIETFDLPTVFLPQVTSTYLNLTPMPDSPVVAWLLNFPSLTYLDLALKWDDPLGSIQQLLLGLPALKSLVARNLPYITTSTLAQITETVRSIQSQNYPVGYISLRLSRDLDEHQCQLELPKPWARQRMYSSLVLDTSLL